MPSSISIPQGSIKRQYLSAWQGARMLFQFHKVRLKGERKQERKHTSFLFQFHKVRLKVRIKHNMFSNIIIFQFHKVRLKVCFFRFIPYFSCLFQFHKVRLKAVDIDNFAPLILNPIAADFNGAKVVKSRRCAMIYFSWSFDNSVFS